MVTWLYMRVPVHFVNVSWSYGGTVMTNCLYQVQLIKGDEDFVYYLIEIPHACFEHGQMNEAWSEKTNPIFKMCCVEIRCVRPKAALNYDTTKRTAFYRLTAVYGL
jgi:hypothetical protein